MDNILVDIVVYTLAFVFSCMSPLAIWVGEAVLWVFTVGHHKPRFKISGDPGKVYFWPVGYPSFWVGLVVLMGFAFWLKNLS